MKRVLVLGYYGFGNYGDELILAAVQDELAAIDCEAVFAVSRPSQYARPSCARHSLIDRHDSSSMRRALYASDCVMLGGGGLIQDVTSWRSSLYYLGIPFLAHTQRKILISYAQGIGPVSRPWIRHLVGRVFNSMSLIDVRDAESRDLLAVCGVRRQPVYISCDAGLSYLVAAHAKLDFPKHRESCIAVCVNDRFGWTSEQTASFLDCLASHFSARISLVVLFPSADLQFTRNVQGRLLSTSDIVLSPSSQDLLDLCSSAVMTIAGRYHMAVAGIASRSPLVALAYDPKLLHLARSLGFEGITPRTAPDIAAHLVISGEVKPVSDDVFETLDLIRGKRILRLQKTLNDQSP